MTLTEQQQKTVDEAKRYANKIRRALELSVRRRWRPGTHDRCPLETMIGDHAVSVGSDSIIVRKAVADRLSKAGFQTRRTYTGNYEIENPDAVREFVELADDGELPDEIAGSWS